ncbi:MAG: 2-dehydropantoate 2-reductase [Pseudomonadota bacterium]
MNICVFGGGAIGGLIAAKLSQVPNVTVSMIARGEQLAAVRANGIELHSPTGNVNARILATDDPRELGPQDYVFITLKSHQVLSAVPQITALLGPDTVVLPPTTGIPYWYFHDLPGQAPRSIDRLDPGARLWNALPVSQVLGVVYWFACEGTAPGVVHHDGSSVRMPVGEPDGSLSPRLRRLADVLAAAGFDSPAVDNIRAWIWIKMISSLAWNPVAVLTRATLGEIIAEPRLVDMVHRMMAEADTVAARLGAPAPLTIDERIAIARNASGHRMSMLQDVERGRPLELDVLVDSIEAMREIADLPTPTIADVYALLKLHVASMRSAGQIAR